MSKEYTEKLLSAFKYNWDDQHTSLAILDWSAYFKQEDVHHSEFQVWREIMQILSSVLKD